MTDDEDEYEFEYDPVETESFHVELDLSTTNSGGRGHLRAREPAVQPSKNEEPALKSDQPQQISATSPISARQFESRTHMDHQNLGSNPAQRGSGASARSGKLQILDLHSRDPVISFQNQIYSCFWSDMIGTAMFFTEAEDGVEESTLLSKDHYHLIGTSRMKIIGRKAKLTGVPGRKPPRSLDEDQQHVSPIENDQENIFAGNGKSLGEIRTSSASINAGIKRQATFLEKLMDVKRSKGEMDNVRTVFNQSSRIIGSKRAPTIHSETSRRDPTSPPTAQEIEYLNRQVVRGDANALMRLQDIYSSMEDGELTSTLSHETQPTTHQHHL